MSHALRSIGRALACTVLTFAVLAHADEMTVAQAYAALGLARGATDGEIKAAHRRLLMTNHPDHAGEAGRAKTAEINRARDVLKAARAKVVRPATKSAQAAERPPASPAPPPRTAAVDPRFEFTPAVPGQPNVVGFGVNAKLADFPVLHMIDRSHEYAAFLRALQKFVNQKIAPAYHRPFWVYGAHPLELRWKTLRSMPTLVQLTLGAAELTAIADASLGHDVTLLFPATVAGLEYLTRRFTAAGRADARAFAEALEASAEGLRRSRDHRDYDAEALKIALLNYDFVAMLAYENVDRHLGEAMYFRRVMRIAKFFPLARAGLLLRAHAGVGSAALWRPNLRREIARHPVAWMNVVRWIEEVDVTGEIDCADLREAMGIPENAWFARAAAPAALVTDWSHVACEFALAQVPPRWRPARP